MKKEHKELIQPETVETLEDVKKLGFVIHENIRGILDINEVYLEEDINLDKLGEHGYSSNEVGRNYDFEEINFTLLKDEEEVLENATAEDILNFFKNGDYLKHK